MSCPVLTGPQDLPCIRAAWPRPDLGGSCCDEHYRDIVRPARELQPPRSVP